MTALSSDPSFMADPFPRYAALRAQAPAHRATTPDGAPVWLVTRYDDVRAAFADPNLSLDKRNSTTGYRGFTLPPALDANLLNMDPPAQRRVRRLVTSAFTARRVEALRPRVQAEVDRLLDVLGDSAGADLMAGLAGPLPLTVIGDLLGVPTRHRERFRGWTNTLLAPDPANPGAAKDAVLGMHRFLVKLVQATRDEPADNLLSALIEARDGGDRLSEDELTSLAFLILWAGYENAVHVIGNGLLALLSEPPLPAAIDDTAVDELLRTADPNQFAIRRFPLRDTEIGGVRIPAGETVLLCVASANRDPATFVDPERLDLDRADNAHLSFGHGVHYCVGAPLARLEVSVAINAVLRRFPGARLAIPVAELRWRPSFRSRGLLTLPVRLR